MGQLSLQGLSTHTQYRWALHPFFEWYGKDWGRGSAFRECTASEGWNRTGLWALPGGFVCNLGLETSLLYFWEPQLPSLSNGSNGDLCHFALCHDELAKATEGRVVLNSLPSWRVQLIMGKKT